VPYILLEEKEPVHIDWHRNGCAQQEISFRQSDYNMAVIAKYIWPIARLSAQNWPNPTTGIDLQQGANMIRTNISSLKKRLSHYLRMVRAGEVIEIVDRKTPLARIEAVEAFGSSGKTTGWLRRMVEPGMIAAPPKKLSLSEFARLPIMCFDERLITAVRLEGFEVHP
jgi:antitoxin (DNA-binding transcriptional repressor) of toxin-antitoxin stability system